MNKKVAVAYSCNSDVPSTVAEAIPLAANPTLDRSKRPSGITKSDAPVLQKDARRLVQRTNLRH